MNEACPLDTIFHETVMDYFSRMGGAGQWMVPNYQDWYPAAFTLIIGLRHFSLVTEEQYQLARMVLPDALFDGCDGLLASTKKAFLQFEAKYGRPDETLSFSHNEMIESFERRSRSEGIRKDLGRERHYKQMLAELERFCAIMRDQPPIEEHLRRFSFKNKEY
jgi:hypothetical protein